ncbi:HvfC/BufC N-terminal domain-containing protein [Oceanomicrobium pacificus]|uniref:DUF2063 domain-containing protein n=1 Tax=Oceanomicrobium pacificus TaxID=2692916 RepID=A0A6B0TNS9_9RHOB|nr:DNA-binding domain-containing protein [Oceanomicrobium pacificus]MXU66207.1 DUF2063 domain-containing protein [Oceanomicrobium pacificus]
MTLPDQTAFTAALLDPAQPVPDGIVNPDGSPARRRFDVYRNNVVAGLVEALQAAYPTVRRIVGEKFFDAMAAVYVRAHPPTDPLMILYGAELPAFLDGFPPAASLPYLPDVARLEYARRQAYHAPDAATIQPERLGAVPPEELDRAVLGLHPSLRIVASDHPVLSIWRFNNEEGAAKPEPGAEAVLICRPDLSLSMRAIPLDAPAFIADLQSGATLGAAAAAASTRDAGFDLGLHLGGLLSSNCLVSVTIEGVDDHDPPG